MQTGRLRNSISHRVMEDKLIGIVGTNVTYAKSLELGRAGGRTIVATSAKVLADWETGRVFGKRVTLGKMAPRPFLRPTAERERSRIAMILGG